MLLASARAFEMCTPRLRWVPEHWKQMKLPRLTDAHAFCATAVCRREGGGAVRHRRRGVGRRVAAAHIARGSLHSGCCPAA